MSHSAAPHEQKISLSLTWLILGAMLLAGLVPLAVLSVSAVAEYEAARVEATSAATTALDDKSIAYLQIWSEQVAKHINEFLDARARDTRIVAHLPRTADAYLNFYDESQGDLWYETGPASAPVQHHARAPLYRSIAYIGADGWEKLRIADGKVVPKQSLRYVADPANTTYKTETYFARARALPAGDVFMSHLMAWYTSDPAQPAGTVPPGSAPGAAYAKYVGVIRFATPVFTPDGTFDGVVVLSLDYRHIMEYVIHIQPTAKQRQVVWPDFADGNYAVLFDDQGYLIAHPILSEMRGLDASGHLVSPMTPKMSPAKQKLHPFNLLDNGPALAETFRTTLDGQSTYAIHRSTSGLERADITSPIPLPPGVVGTSGYFGGVSIGANVADFHQAATTVRTRIEAEEARLRTRLGIIVALDVVFLVIVAILVARSITRPLIRLTGAARAMEQGELDTTTLDTLGHRRITDEVTVLSRVFTRMAEQVQLRERTLKQEIVDLQIQIDEQKKQQEIREIVDSDFFKDLQANAHAMRARYRKKEAGKE